VAEELLAVFELAYALDIVNDLLPAALVRYVVVVPFRGKALIKKKKQKKQRG